MSRKLLDDIYEVLLIDPEVIRPETRNFHTHNRGLPFDPKEHAKKNNQYLTKVDETESGHHIYHVTDKDDPTQHAFYAWHPKDKTAHVTVRGYSEDGEDLPSSMHIGMLGAHENSTMKAHELYHHMIKNQNMTLTTDEQTMGGFKVWQKLAESPDVSVRGFNHESGRFSRPKTLKDISDTHRSLDQLKTKKDQKIASTLLVASPKRTK